jgi:hypothetical protein
VSDVIELKQPKRAQNGEGEVPRTTSPLEVRDDFDLPGDWLLALSDVALCFHEV